MRVQRDMDSPSTHRNRLITWLVPKLQDGVVVALLMAFVATLGALAAFRAASVEQELSKLENKLNQSQILELTTRQEYMDRYAQRGRFDDEYNQHVSEGGRLRKEADQLRSVDPTKAARRDVEAQEEFNVARILRPYLRATYVPWMDTNLTVQQAVDKNVAYDLKQIGFESQWTDPGTSGNDRRPMWGSASRNPEVAR
jgi:hypothetical protein